MKKENAGMLIMRFGMILVLGWIGLFKFTPTEAKAIEDLIVNSPFFSWMYTAFGLQGTSNLIGTVEILTALAFVAGIKLRKAEWLAGLLGTMTFAATLSFLFTTPGMLTRVDGLWVANGFLLKDIALLGFAVHAFQRSAIRLQIKASAQQPILA